MQQQDQGVVVDILLQGGVIAYPTEAVYGLGCDPYNDGAISRILKLKQRPWQKGLILVASNYQQLQPFVDETQLTANQLQVALDKWPGPFTFTMPVKAKVSSLLTGNFGTIAVRVSSHPTIRLLCDCFGRALVSTSANLAGESPALSAETLLAKFDDNIDAIAIGELGTETSASTITDLVTGAILRS